MKLYKDPIFWIIILRALVVLGGYILLIWIAATMEVTVSI